MDALNEQVRDFINEVRPAFFVLAGFAPGDKVAVRRARSPSPFLSLPLPLPLLSEWAIVHSKFFNGRLFTSVHWNRGGDMPNADASRECIAVVMPLSVT